MGRLWPGGPLEMPLTFRVDGERYRLDLPVPKLFDMLARGTWWELLPNALPDRQRQELLTRLFLRHEYDHLDYVHLWKVSTDLLGRLAGTTPLEGGHGYAPAHRIAASLRHNWMLFSGWSLRHGTDPLTLPLHQLIALGYRMLLESRRDERDVQQLESQIWQVPESMPEAVPRWTRDEEALSGLAVLAELDPGALAGVIGAQPQARP